LSRALSELSAPPVRDKRPIVNDGCNHRLSTCVAVIIPNGRRAGPGAGKPVAEN